MNLRVFAALCLALCSSALSAHGVATSYVQLATRDASSLLAVQVDIGLRDLDTVIDLDPDRDNDITWGEVDAARTDIEHYVSHNLQLERGAARCEWQAQDLLTDIHADGPYAVIKLLAKCAEDGAVRVHSDLLYETDLTQRTVLTVTHGEQSFTSVLTNEQRDWNSPALHGAAAAAHDTTTAFADLRRFIEQGVWHIWTGYDHLAFLLLLLLPAVIQRNTETTTRIMRRLLGVVTAFTLAHSLTLALAALGFVKLPTRLTEAGIAASIAISGVFNLYPRTRNSSAWTAFCFGLIHGFGFASALADLNLELGNRVATLVGFNAGVELGQLAIVAVLLPGLLWARRTVFYPRVMLPVLSLSLSALGALWFWQRAFS